MQVTLSGAVQVSSAIHLLSVTGPRDEARSHPALRSCARRLGYPRKACPLPRPDEDNSGEARLDAQLTYRGVPVVEGKAGFAPATWDARRGIHSTRSLLAAAMQPDQAARGTGSADPGAD